MSSKPSISPANSKDESFMRVFLRGWKRKFGLVALVCALLMTSLWIKSLETITTATLIRDEGPRHQFVASPQGLTWMTRSGAGQYVHGTEFLGLEWDFAAIDPKYDESEFVDGWHSEWERKFAGFRFGRYQLGHRRRMDGEGLSLVMATVSVRTIPHWSVVLPMVLAAWLLLSKQRSAHSLNR